MKMNSIFSIVLLLCVSPLCILGGKFGDDMIGSAYFLINLKVDDYILPFLNYSVTMLEPYIDAATGRYHYEGHHENYRVKLNAIREQWRTEVPNSELAKESVLFHLQNLELLPEKYRTDMKNHGGGFVNHALYFGIMSPNLDEEERIPLDYLMEEIKETFGSWEEFKEQFEAAASKLFGSGYVWLVRNPDNDDSLYITTTSNQYSPLNFRHYPILILDMWEHSYYLQHQYKKMNYVKNWWSVVDWKKVMGLDTFWKKIQHPDPVEKKEEL